MPETAKPTYHESTWETKLALMRQQLQDSLVGDAGIARQVKNLKRKDFAQQRNFKSADVELTADNVINHNRVSRWSGILNKMGPKRMGGSGGGGAPTGPRNIQMKNPFKKNADNAATRVTHTGTTTVLNPGAAWTTEGWQPVSSLTPESSESLRVLHKNESILPGFGGKRSGKALAKQGGRSMLGQKYKNRGGPAKGSGDPDQPLSVTVRPTVPPEE